MKNKNRTFRKFWGYFGGHSDKNEPQEERFGRFVYRRKLKNMGMVNSSFGSIRDLTNLEEDILDKDGGLEPIEVFNHLDKAEGKLVSDSLELEKEHRQAVFNFIKKEQEYFEYINSDFKYESYNLEQDQQDEEESVFQEKVVQESNIKTPPIREKNALPKENKDHDETDIAQYGYYLDHHANRKGEEMVNQFFENKTWSTIPPLKEFRENPSKPTRKGNILSYLTNDKYYIFILVLLGIELVEIKVILAVFENIWNVRGWKLALYSAIPIAFGSVVTFAFFKHIHNWLRSDMNRFKEGFFVSFLGLIAIVLALLIGLINADFQRTEDAMMENNMIVDDSTPDFSSDSPSIESSTPEIKQHYPLAKEIFYPLLSVFLMLSVAFKTCIILVFSKTKTLLKEVKKSKEKILDIEKQYRFNRKAITNLLTNSKIIVHLLGEHLYYSEIYACPHTKEEIDKILTKKKLPIKQ
ncbi:hypothetical protein ACQY1Q_10440 [Tenacibaculum sp. TC6]|uniref:hypothetical protein n=1 Tax=Tenacibaculum sp. TC6 TaxID=3423223 RepID=UPI003D36444E